jgi:heptosyltransferase-1
MRPRNVLIIKLSALGDIVMATPVIKAVKNACPNARLSWLVEEASRGIVEGNPLLDEVLIWRKGEWVRLLRKARLFALASEITSFIGELRRRRFDAVYDLQGFLKSAVWARLSGARERVGLDSKEGSRALMTRVIPWDRSEKRIGAQYLQFVRGLGIEPGEFEMDIAVGEEEERFAADFREANSTDGRYAALCPFSSKPQKEWVHERWVELSSRLISEHGLRPVMLGGPGDVEAAKRMASSDIIINMVGKTTVKQTAALIKHASLLIGGDTGLTHMGIAFDVPTVAIFGSTFPYHYTDRDNTALIYKALDCSPCKRHPTCGGNFRCMEEITGGEVLESVARVLHA